MIGGRQLLDERFGVRGNLSFFARARRVHRTGGA